MNLATLNKNEILKHYPYVAELDEPGANVDDIGDIYASVIGFATSPWGPVAGKTIASTGSSKMIVPKRAFILPKAAAEVGWGKKGVPAKETARRRSKTGPNYWTMVKQEFYQMICTTDKKYSKVRSDFKKSTRKASTVVVGTISAAIAGTLGIAVGLITPLVAFLLYALVKLGLNSWCSLETAKAK